MKIVVYSQVPPPVHGSTIVTQQLIDVLREQGHDVFLLDRRFSKATGEVGVPSLRKVLAVFSLWMRTVFAVVRRPHVAIFFGTNRPASFFVDLTVSAIMHAARVPIVQYLHTVGFQRLADKSRLHRALVSRLLSDADHIVCLASSIAQDVAPFARTQVSTIRNTVDPLLRHPRRIPPRFIYLANLIPAKGAMDVVEIARRAAALDLEASFEIWGFPAESAFFEQLVAAIEKVPSVEYKGPLRGHAEKSRAVAAATALLYPSRYEYEAQPLAIIEAMSVGVPTIAYDIGAIGELVGGSRAGTLCTTIDDMSAAVCEYIELDAHAWQRQSDAALRQYEQDHAVSRFAMEWSNLLTDFPRSTKSRPSRREAVETGEAEG